MPSGDFCTPPHKVQISMPFLRVRLWNFAHVFSVPLPSLFRGCVCVCVCFFSAENVGSLETQISQKNTQTQISDEKNKKQKTSIRSRLGRGALNTCKISGSNSQKRRGRWHLKEFGVLCLNQPVHITGIAVPGTVYAWVPKGCYRVKM